jgi:putative addiction module component (TIGR02574 family)
MKRDPSDILRDALKLPEEARAAIAGQLLDSLDPAVDADAEAAWDQEILRCLRDVESGAVQLVPWSEVRRRLARE